MTFQTRYEYFEFLVMSFGLTNAPAIFIDFDELKFLNHIYTCLVVIIDEIVIFFRSKEEHVGHLSIMLQTLMDNYLFAKFSKCEFRLREVIFLIILCLVMESLLI